MVIGLKNFHTQTSAFLERLQWDEKSAMPIMLTSLLVKIRVRIQGVKGHLGIAF